MIDGHRSGSIVEIRSGKLLDIICRASGGKPEPDMRWVRTENGHETEMKGESSITTRFVNFNDSISIMTHTRHFLS